MAWNPQQPAVLYVVRWTSVPSFVVSSKRKTDVSRRIGWLLCIGVTLNNVYRGNVEDTCQEYNQPCVHIQSVGRYGSIGVSCHWESDKKRTVGDSSLPKSVATCGKWKRRVSDSPLPLPLWPLSLSTLFSSFTYHERK